MNVVVLDAGHGGRVKSGSSTSEGIRGGRGTLEKDLTLDVAVRTRQVLERLGYHALLTRERDRNPSLSERTFCSRSEVARAFVSLHFNASPPGGPGAEVWLHDRGGPPSRHLAEALVASLKEEGAGARGPLHGPLAVLDPAFQAAGCAACLVELADLTDPEEEMRLLSPDHLDALAAAVARGIVAGTEASAEAGSFAVRAVEETFDVWHEVPLVQQLTGMSCWAAAAAMLVGWRDCIDIDPEQVAAGSGRWEAYRAGLVPEDVQALADAWDLVVEQPRRYTTWSLRDLLIRNGPLWVGEASPGLHVVVVAGMRGDGSPEGTKVHIADPWPVGKGERYALTFAELARNLDVAAGISGVPAQVLHTGGRGSSRTIVRRRREFSLSHHPAGPP
jgi:N-acetylmuramoyl-L-alanine amidase